MFDITMGGYLGAEKCDLVGLYLLSIIKHFILEVGVFCDDGLAISRLTKRENKNMKKKKEICRIFKKEGLDKTISAN